MPTAAGTPRGLRDRPVGKVLLLAAVLAAAFLVSKSCGSSENAVSQERAKEIARTAVDFEPDRVGVRYLKRGLQSRGFWAVSLSRVNEAGELVQTTVVVVDGQTGRIEEIRKGSD